MEEFLVPRAMPTLRDIRQAKKTLPDLDPIGHYAINELVRVCNEIQAALDRSVGRHGLSFGRYVALTVVWKAGRAGTTAAEIADELKVTRATMTGLIDNLERDGLIVRERHTTDRRRIIIRCLPKAIAVLRQTGPEQARGVARAVSVLTIKEKKELIRLMAKLSGSVHRIAE